MVLRTNKYLNELKRLILVIVILSERMESVSKTGDL